MRYGKIGISAALLAGISVLSVTVAQATPRLVTQPIDDARSIALLGNTHPDATLKNDRGRVADTMVLHGMQMLLKRPVETQAALDRQVEALTDRDSPEYHHWISADALGETYGPAPEDIAAVTSWLQAHGFVINGVQPDRMTIDFDGTAGQIREAFRTEIHNLDVRGVHHIANMSNPRVPAALADVVEGIVSLHDFRPHTNYKPRPQYTAPFDGSTFLTVVPADLATIYNFNPLFKAGITGKGQTIVVIEDTNVVSTADWTKFRKTFGLSSYTTASFTTVHPAGASACSSPGINGAEGEASLDAEWASAAAPGAAIVLASCADSTTTFGGLIAFQNLIAEKTHPKVVSISYGYCEAYNGATANAAYKNAYETAAAGGVSVFVSSGDESADSCDADLGNATHGIGVSGFASTPYNVAVGGTDFADTYLKTNSTYWNTTNTSTYGSAKSYIPEIPWNDSCASTLVAKYLGYATTYGTSGFCNSSEGEANFLTTAGGSGAPSGCATGAPATAGVVGGTCKGYAKPGWQVLFGNPADNVRDVPDVSLFAANGLWSHFYIYCNSDTAEGGAACTGAPNTWSGAGGTSFASPIVAGVQALVNEKTGSAQGNPNPTLYKLAATEYGKAGSTTCNSEATGGPASTCIFYDVTLGDMDINCTGTHDCYKPSGTYGVLSSSDTTYTKAYGTKPGYDFSTGIGTINAANLVNNW
jgi:subtilase family serine protease